MAQDFQANIVANLDLSKAQSELTTFLSGNHKLEIDVSVKNNALNNFIKNFSSQGSNAGQAFAKSFNASLGTMNTRAMSSQMNNIRSSLRDGFGLKSSAVNSITKDLDNLGIQITNVTTRLNESAGRGRNALNLKIDGIDQMGRAVSYAQQYSLAGERLSSTLSTVSKAQKEITDSAKSEFGNKMTSWLNNNEVAADAYAEKIKGIRTALHDAKTESDFKNVKSSWSELKSEAEAAGNVGKRATDQMKGMMNDKMSIWLNNNSKAAKKYSAEIENIQKAVSSATKESQLKSLNKDFEALTLRAERSGNIGKTIGDSLKSTFAGVGQFLISYASIYQVFNAVRDGIQTIVGLDDALVDLKKTTSATSTELNQFYSSANSIAKEYGTTTQQIIQGTADWSRLGYSLEDSKTMSALSSQFASISPGMEVSSATDYLVGVMKAYKITASDAKERIVSEVNEVGNNFALTNEDVMTALRNSASSMSAANNSFEQTVGLITAGTEVTQNAQKVGNGLRTISMRIRGMNEETEELDSGLVNIKGDIAELTNGKVSIMEDANTYRSTYDILKDISDVWDELTDKQQAKLLEKLFGKNRAEIGAAIISNFQSAEDAVKTMSNAAGSADREMGTIQQSLSYKINAMKETMTGIWQGLIDRGSLGVVVDGITGFLTVIEKLTSSVGLFGTAMTAVAAINVGKVFATMSKDGLSFVDALSKISPLFSSLRTQAGELGAAISMAMSDGSGLTGILSAFGESTATFASVAAIAGAATAIVGAIALYEHLNVSAKEAQENMKQSLSSYQDSTSNVENLKDELSSVDEQIASIKSKGKLSFTDQSDLANLQKQKQALETNIALAERQQEVDAKKLARDTQTAYEKNFGNQSQSGLTDEVGRDIGLTSTGSDKFRSSLKAYTAAVDRQSELSKNAQGLLKKNSDELSRAEQKTVNDYNNQTEYVDKLSGNLSESVGMLTEYRDNLEALPSNLLTPKQRDELKEINGLVDEYYQAIDPEGFKASKISDAFGKTSGLKSVYSQLESLAKLNKDMGGITALDVQGLTAAYPNLLSNLEEFNISAQDIADNINATISSYFNGLGDTTSIFDSVNGKVANFSGYQTNLQAALNASASATGVTVEQMQLLADSYGSLESYDPTRLFEATANGIHINRQEMERLNAEMENQTLSSMYDDLALAQKAYNEAVANGDTAKANNLLDDITNAQLAISSYEGLTSAYNKWVSAQSVGNDRDAYESLGSSYDAMKKTLDAGWYGDDSLNAYLDTMLSVKARTGDAVTDFAKLTQTIEGTSHSIKDYWQTDSSGSLVTDGLFDFLDDVHKVFGDAYASVDEEGQYAFDITGNKLQEVADRFGMSTELVELFARALADAGMNVNFSDNIRTDGIAEKVSEAQSILKSFYETSGQETSIDLDFSVDTASTAELQSYIAQLQGERVNIDTSANPEAAQALEELMWQTQQEYLVRLGLNGDQVAYGATLVEYLADAISNAQSRGDIDVTAEVTGDSRIDSLANEIASLPPEVQTKIGINTENVGNVGAIKAQIASGLGTVNVPVQAEIKNASNLGGKLLGSASTVTQAITQTVNYKAGNTAALKLPTQTATVNYTTGSVAPLTTKSATVNYTLGNQAAPASPKTAKVNYTLGSQANVKAKSAKINYTLGSQASPSSRSAKVNYTLGSQASPSSKSAKVNYTLGSQANPLPRNATVNYVTGRVSGTAGNLTANLGSAIYGLARGTMSSAYADGTAYNVVNYGNAYANGRVSLPHNENALVNEIGQESVIRNGSWMLLPAGMHMQSLKKGDIVLNAKQTASLIKYGKAAGQGRALANGTLSGSHLSNAYVSGSGGRRRTGSSSSSSTSTARSSSSSRSSGSRSSSSGSSSSGSSATSSSDDYVDWIAIRIAREEREIKNLQKVVDDTYLVWSKRNTALSNEISKVTAEISTQQSAYSRYIQQANSIGLSSSIKQLVRDGKIDIVKYNEDTRKLISQYQSYYEAALNCADAVDDLKSSLKDLYDTEVDNILARWDESINRLQHSAERAENIISRRSSYASDFVTNDNAKAATEANLKTYQYLLQNSLSQINLKEQELAELGKKISDGVGKGIVEKDSAGYIALLNQIQDIENELDGLNADVITYSNNISEQYSTLFDIIADNYDNEATLLKHLETEYSTYLDIAKNNGLSTSQLYYEKLQEIERQNMQANAQMAKDLQASLNAALKSGEIKQYSNAWYDMTSEINNAIEATLTAEKSLTSYINSARKANWERFDDLQDTISHITDETDFLIKQMEGSDLFNDSGSYTNKGLATLGLRGMNYNVEMAQADKYAQEILKLNKEIANDTANTNLLDRKEELLKAQRNSIKAAKTERDAIKSLVESGIKKQISSIGDLIDEYTDALSASKDLYEYQDKISDATSEISQTRKKLNAYANDMSEEGRAKVQKLQLELKDQEKELAEKEYEQMIADAKKLLSDFKDDYQDALNARLDNVDSLLEDTIQTINDNSSTIADTIQRQASEVGYTLNDYLTSAWSNGANNIEGVVTKYGSNFSNLLTTTNSMISQITSYVQGIWNASDAQAAKDIESTKNEQASKASAESNAVKNSAAGTKNAAEKAQSSGWYLGGKNNSTRFYRDTNGQNKTGWLTDTDSKKYYIDENTGNVATGWQSVNGKWYYMDSSGVTQTGWQTVNGKKYYFGSSGVMATGWNTIDGKD